MLGVLAVVAAVLVWQWRAHRGPVMVAALAVGAAAAAGAAAGVGAVLVHWRYGAIDIAARAGVARASRALRHRGARGVLRALAAADRGDDPVSRRGRGAGLRADGGVDRARRSRRVAARRTAGLGPPVTAETLHRPPSDHLRGDLAPAAPCRSRSSGSAASATWSARCARQRLAGNRSVSQRSVIGADIGCSSMCSLNMSRW